MENICKRVGKAIRRYREQKGISQEKLAELADLHRTYIGQVERGEKNLTLLSIERIAKALGVNVKDLL
ncbi:MAG TPA: helix-turn-helix transcriptional regulator [Anaerohalosphaeraceae bacterium]|nr:helix-turn-helix transcriptional regulator [Anaerohalosphaeraceae bacterium]HOL88235.1 helix-turn-helix transcriptional regulator [Anaerohalosphaeraceae bacterium]HPP56094.1 helix-turn-helix transcriptional regulator [Anaerohalosphaeraceae bacterium]